MTRWDTEGTCPYGKVVGMYVCVCRSNGSRGKLLLERASEFDAVCTVCMAVVVGKSVGKCGAMKQRHSLARQKCVPQAYYRLCLECQVAARGSRAGSR